MDKTKNNLKAVIEAVNADTNTVKAELISSGIPRSTLYHYIANPNVDIKASHVKIIMRVTKCNLDDLIVEPATVKNNPEFNLSN